MRRSDPAAWLVWAGLMTAGTVFGSCSGCASEWIWPFQYGERGEGAPVLFLEALARTAVSGLFGLVAGGALAWRMCRRAKRSADQDGDDPAATNRSPG
jgi:hypothetical protein